MRPYLAKLAALACLLFVVLWGAGVVRALAMDEPPPTPRLDLLLSPEAAARAASANNLRQVGLLDTPLPLMLDQPELDRVEVHEKTAQIGLSSRGFDGDVARLRAALAAHQAKTFGERNHGITPERKLFLHVGVHPDKFEALVAELRGIARLEAITDIQRDRTGELRRLNAQRQSLKRHLDAVLKLRGGKNSTVDNELKVEQKIQDIEKEMQSLSVQLGDLLGKESFYQVQVTLHEVQPGGPFDRGYGLGRRVFGGGLWALAWWSGAVALLGAVAAGIGSVRLLRA